MSVEFKAQVRELVWQLIQKYYNVDKKQPYLLTSKSIVINNPINDIADHLSVFIEQILMEVAKEKEATDEEKVVPFDLKPNDDDDHDSFLGSTWPLWSK